LAGFARRQRPQEPFPAAAAARKGAFHMAPCRNPTGFAVAMRPQPVPDDAIRNFPVFVSSSVLTVLIRQFCFSRTGHATYPASLQSEPPLSRAKAWASMLGIHHKRLAKCFLRYHHPRLRRIFAGFPPRLLGETSGRSCLIFMLSNGRQP
jgi:hypothetical protein